MTAAAPWSVKGIDPKAREIAKDLARRSGMTLGEWLNRMIVEGEAPSTPDYAPEHALDTPSHDPKVIATPRAAAGERYEVPGHPADEVGRVAEAMERLTDRIEAAEQRSTLAITGIDQSVRGALARLEAAEREQIAVAARFEGAVEDIRTDHGGFGERLRKIELESSGPRSAEALRSLEGMLGKVAGQFYDGEARTREAVAAIEARVAEIEKSDPANLVEAVAARVADRLVEAESRTTDALRDLGSSFVALDRRLRAVESGGGSGAERLEALAADLTRRMEATRAELGEKLAASATARFDRMDRKLSEMASHVATAEARSAEAIERVGREMVSMADTLSRRVQGVENRSADAMEQMGGEVSRIATAVEQKLGRADTAQAQALEKLGGEIARITERLAERIANSERRGALAIDEVGEQVARVTERITQRQERTATDLAERIRLSEERTARLLDEAREKIDASLNGVRRTVESAAPPPAPSMTRRSELPAGPFEDPFATEPFPSPAASIPDDAFAPQAYAPQAFSEPFAAQEPFGRTPPVEAAPAALAPFPAVERGEPSFSQEDFDAADFAEIDAAPEVPEAPEIPPAPVIDPLDIDEGPRARSTREVIEQARLAARSSGGMPASSLAAPSAEKRSLFGGRERKPKRRAGSTLQTALLVTGAAAAVGVSAAGLLMANGEGGGKQPERLAAMMRIAEQDKKGEITGREADTAPGGAAPIEAVAIAPEAATETPLAGAATTASAESPASLYAEGMRQLAAKTPEAAATLRKAANLGYAPAQFQVAKLYYEGLGGVRKDEVEGRRWTERAAQGGEPRAMHNLGLAYYNGAGGPMNKTTAAQWFRRAADLGWSNSQFNLANLYEQGYGVEANAAEAYKWYLIASRTGDAEARSSAERIRRSLSPEARAAAERSALGYRPATPNATVRQAVAAPAIAAASADVASAQRALSMLGFYRGPQDGAPSGALKGAIQAFQKEKGLPATGELDAETVSKLSIYAR
ncbi:MAG: SEL1-like repeat protein [Caulobacter sp.]|nr:SEL1-like repeat protein [Caulobacter sp.]